MPWTKVDLALRREGCAPNYFWELVPPSNAGEIDLAELPCIEGGSVLGQVVDANGVGVAGAEVRLMPSIEHGFHSGEGGMAEMDRTARRGTATVTNRRGFFQMVDITSGSFRVEARHDDYLPGRSETAVVVRGDLEAELTSPVILHKPTTVKLTLEPAVDPYGDPWKVRLVGIEPDRELALVEGKVREDLQVLENLAPGWYQLEARDVSEGLWLVERLEVLANASGTAETIEFIYQIPLVEISGEVTLDGDPYGGEIRFGQGHAQRQVALPIDDNGLFIGFLPSVGTYWVQVSPAESPSLSVTLEPVEIEEQDGPVELEIEIPATRIEGRVLRADGSAAAGAGVRIQRARSGESTSWVPASDLTAAEDGSFEIQGLLPGTLSLMARQGELTSESIQVDLSEDLDPPAQELVLRETRELEVRIVSAQGPVVGAGVFVTEDLLRASGTRSAVGGMGVTNALGSLHREIPEDVRHVLLLVRAEGFGARFLRSQVGADGVIEVVLAPEEGSLELDLSSTQGRGILFSNGQRVPLGLARMFLGLGRENGQSSFQLESLEPGFYELCRPDAESRVDGLAEGCVGGALAPGGMLRLAAPPPQSLEDEPAAGLERKT